MITKELPVEFCHIYDNKGVTVGGLERIEILGLYRITN
jgi:hypothetical protein